MQIQTDEMRKAMGEADGVMTHGAMCSGSEADGVVCVASARWKAATNPSCRSFA